MMPENPASPFTGAPRATFVTAKQRMFMNP